MSESNRDKAARGGWGLGAVAEVDLSANRRTLLSDGVLRVFADDGVNVLREERLVTAGNVGAADRVIRLNGGGPSEGITSMVEPATNPQPAPGQVCRATPANFGALPNPAPGQVWVPPAGEWADRFVDADGTVTVATADGTTVRFVGGGGCADVDMDGPANGWRCVGVATEHGRVMVGDGFRFDDGPEATVTAVCDHDSHVRMSDGMAHSAGWVLAFGKRTCYAPARAGERYRERSGREVIAIESVRTGLSTMARMSGGEMCGITAGHLDPALWERLDPWTANAYAQRVTTPGKPVAAAPAAAPAPASHPASQLPLTLAVHPVDGARALALLERLTVAAETIGRFLTVDCAERPIVVKPANDRAA